MIKKIDEIEKKIVHQFVNVKIQYELLLTNVNTSFHSFIKSFLFEEN